LECGEDEHLELAEKVAFGHGRLSTNAKIYATTTGRVGQPVLSNVLAAG
jgi:hypothetical protein